MSRVALASVALFAAFAVACSSSSSDSPDVEADEGALETGQKTICTPVERDEATVDHRGEVFQVQKITFTMRRDESVQLKVDRKTDRGRAMDPIVETTPSYVQTDRTLRASAKRNVMLKAGKSRASDEKYVGFVTVHDHTFAVECEAAQARQPRPQQCRAGTTRPDVDGCNTCTCESDGSWACTEMFCVHPQRPSGNGSTCRDGASRPAGDGCNTCTCNDGHYACTELACGGHPSRNDDSGSCREGATQRLDSCNTCTCNGGHFACTELFCN